MSRRSFVFWSAMALLMALPHLAAAQYWEVRDTSTNQVVYPTGTVSVFEDITYPTVAQRVYQVHNVSDFFNLPIGPCSIIADDPSFVISVYPYLPGHEGTPLPHGLSTVMAVQHLAYTPGTQTVTVQCYGTIASFTFKVRGRILDPNPYIILETSKGNNVANGGTFDFGSTPAGTGVTRDFRIINMGNQALTVSLSLTGSAYSLTTAAPTRVGKGSEAAFSLRLLSSTLGPATGQLRINNNDPNYNPYTVNLTGSVTPVLAPQISITDNGNNNAVVVKGSTINLGSTPPNIAINRTFTITNTGNTTLSITNPTSFLTAAGFTIFTSAPNSLGAGSGGPFVVRFQAASGGSYSGTVSLASNDADDNPFAFNLQAAVKSIRVVDQTTGQTIVPGAPRSPSATRRRVPW